MRTALALAALTAALALPGIARAEKETVVVPPNNSAATQYTETFPTSGGNAEVQGGSAGSRGRGPSGGISRQTAKALQEEGAAGRAVEQLVQESASGPTAAGSHVERAGGGATGGHRSNGVSGDGTAASGARGVPAGGAPGASEPAGSSGAGEVVSHATLTSSGGMGVFLPLVLVAALIAAVIFAWRRRHRDAPPAGTVG